MEMEMEMEIVGRERSARNRQEAMDLPGRIASCSCDLSVAGG